MRRALAAAAAAFAFAAPAVAVDTHDAAQATADHAAAWLTDTLDYRVPAVPVVVDEGVMMRHGGDAAVEFRWLQDRHGVIRQITSHQIVAAPLMAWRWSEAQRRPVHAKAVQGLIHELLHRADTLNADRGIEEGIVDAVAVDLTPAYCWRAWRTRCAARPTYPGHVAAVRAASAHATASTTWRTRDARLWRRALLAADHAGRQAMLAGVGR